MPPDGTKLYTKPVVLLTSAGTYSAAEDFAVAFDAAKRGTIIGETTGGSTGQPLMFKLPGGGLRESARSTTPIPMAANSSASESIRKSSFTRRSTICAQERTAS